MKRWKEKYLVKEEKDGIEQEGKKCLLSKKSGSKEEWTLEVCWEKIKEKVGKKKTQEREG